MQINTILRERIKPNNNVIAFRLIIDISIVWRDQTSDKSDEKNLEIRF